MAAVRRPAVAGTFYPGSRARLEQALGECFTSGRGPGSLPQPSHDPLPGPVFLMVPHAGYVYSGATAAWAFAELAERGRPEVAFILGPNHRGLTAANTIDTADWWETPLGESPVAESVGQRVKGSCRWLVSDPHGGMLEHSLEVQLPFLQFLYGCDLPIVPIMVSTHDYGALAEIGRAIADAAPRSTVVIASTDMTHFEPADEARKRDAPALEAVKALDGEGLARVVTTNRISMCGGYATAAAIEAAKRLGVTACRVLKYSTSGDVTGDKGDVVAYASAIAE